MTMRERWIAAERRLGVAIAQIRVRPLWEVTPEMVRELFDAWDAYVLAAQDI